MRTEKQELGMQRLDRDPPSMIASRSQRATGVAGAARRVTLSLSTPLMCILAGLAAACSGCTTVSGTAPRFEPLSIPDAHAVPRVIVYGSVTALLPHYDVTPALEMFLYGPNDYGKAPLRNPQGMTLFADRLFVCDQGLPDVVAIHLKTGRSLPFADVDHRPHCPVAVAADDSHVYVADPKSRCVVVYALNGKLVEELAPTKDVQRRFQPASLLIHEGTLYVGNVGEHRVDRLKLDSREWQAPISASPDAPRLISPTGLAFTADGTLLIVDALQGHVLRYTRGGQWLEPIGRPGRGNGELVRPKQVCVMPSGRIVVADAGRQSLLLFSQDGSLLLEVSGGDAHWTGFTLPVGVLPVPADLIPAVSMPADEYLLVSDELGGTPLTLVGLVTQSPREVTHGQ